MPRIPLAGPTVVPQPVPSGEGVNNLLLGRGLSQIAGTAQAFADQQAAEAARLERSNAMTLFQRGINDELEAIQADPNRIDGVADAFEQKFAPLANEMMAGITSGPEAQLQFRDAAVDMIRQGRASAFTTQYRREGDRAKAQLEAEVGEITRNFLLIDTPVAKATMREKISDAVNSHAAALHIDFDTADELEASLLGGAEQSLAVQRLQKDMPGVLIDEIRSGQYPNIPAENQVKLLGQAVEQLHRQNAEAVEAGIIANPLEFTAKRIYERAGIDYDQGQANALELRRRSMTSFVEGQNRADVARISANNKQRLLFDLTRDANSVSIDQLDEAMMKEPSDGGITLTDRNWLVAKRQALLDKQNARAKALAKAESTIDKTLQKSNAELLETKLLRDAAARKEDPNAESTVTDEDLYGAVNIDPMQGGIRQEDANRLETLRQSLIGASQKRVKDIMRGSEIAQGETYIFSDADDKRALDTWYQNRLDMVGVEADVMDPEWQGFVKQLSFGRGALPTSARDHILGRLNDPAVQPEEQVRAAEFLVDLMGDSPGMAGQIALAEDSSEVITHARNLARRASTIGPDATGKRNYTGAVQQVWEERQKRLAQTPDQTRIELEKTIGTKNIAKWVKSRSLRDDVTDEIEMKGNSADVKSPFFGLAGNVTVYDVLQAIDDEGGDALPAALVADLADGFEYDFSFSGNADQTLEHRWEALLASGWGVDRLMGTNPGPLKWTRHPIQPDADGYKNVAADLAFMIGQHIEDVMPHLDIRKEPTFSERYNALLKARDPFSAFREIGQKQTLLEREVQFGKALVTLPSIAYDILLSGTAAAVTSAATPSLQDLRKSAEAQAKAIKEHAGEPGIDFLVKMTAIQDMLASVATDTYSRAPLPGEVVTPPERGRGFFEAATNTSFPVDLIIELHPLASQVGNPVYQAKFRDDFGNLVQVPESDDDPRPAMFSLDPAGRRSIQIKQGLEAEEQKAQRYLRAYKQLSDNPEVDIDTLYSDQNSSERVRAEKEILRELARGQILSVRDQSPLSSMRRMARDPYLAYAHIQLAKEIQEREAQGLPVTHLEDTQKELDKALARTPALRR